MNYKKDMFQSIYDNTYSSIENYNFHNLVKDMYVDVYAAYINGKILDAGCGEGIHLKRMLKNGHDAYGIELSKVCCEKYLKDVPHENSDIIGFAKKGQIFDGLICMDVLEHIPYENIDETIFSLSKMSNSAFYGIANHSDVLNGVQLHLIQENNNWWKEELSKYYKNVIFITDQFNGLFYYFYCYNKDCSYNSFYNRVNSLIKGCICIDDEREKAIAQIKQEKKNNKDNEIILKNKINYLENTIKQKDIQILSIEQNLHAFEDVPMLFYKVTSGYEKKITELKNENNKLKALLADSTIFKLEKKIQKIYCIAKTHSINKLKKIITVLGLKKHVKDSAIYKYYKK